MAHHRAYTSHIVTAVGICCCTLIGAVPLAAAAQAPIPDSTADSSARRIAPVTITATRQRGTLLSAPLAVTVIGKTELENRKANSVDEVLRTVPGVFAQSRYGTSDVRLVIRVGDYFLDDANAVSVPGFQTLDLTVALRPVGMRSAAQLSGFVTVSNLLDRQFIGSAYTNPDIVNGVPVAYEPGAPRSFVVSISISRGK